MIVMAWHGVVGHDSASQAEVGLGGARHGMGLHPTDQENL